MSRYSSICNALSIACSVFSFLSCACRHACCETHSAAIPFQAYIPRDLNQVIDYERDHDRIATGHVAGGIYYDTINNLLSTAAQDVPKDSGVERVPSEHSPALEKDRLGNLSDSEFYESREEDTRGSDSDQGPSNAPDESKGVSREDAKLARKERRKQVKADRREARKTKVPKTLKKKKKKLAEKKDKR